MLLSQYMNVNSAVHSAIRQSYLNKSGEKTIIPENKKKLNYTSKVLSMYPGKHFWRGIINSKTYLSKTTRLQSQKDPTTCKDKNLGWQHTKQGNNGAVFTRHSREESTSQGFLCPAFQDRGYDE